MKSFLVWLSIGFIAAEIDRDLIRKGDGKYFDARYSTIMFGVASVPMIVGAVRTI